MTTGKTKTTKRGVKIRCTLSQDAVATYTEFAKLNGLPLSTMLRVILEQGLPNVKNAVRVAKETDPQLRLLLARGLQATINDELRSPGRLDHGKD